MLSALTLFAKQSRVVNIKEERLSIIKYDVLIFLIIPLNVCHHKKGFCRSACTGIAMPYRFFRL